MYSILKTQKKKLIHKKYSPVTTSIFLTNFHLLFTFADKSYAVFMLKQENSAPEGQILNQGWFQEAIAHSARSVIGVAILLSKNCGHIYELSIDSNLNIEKRQLQKGMFPKMMGQVTEANNIFNQIGCQIRLHAFLNQNFIIEYKIFDDQKIVFDCYNKTEENKDEYVLSTVEVDLQINGAYITQNCNCQEGEIAIYKQEQIDDVDWMLQILRPFASEENKQIHTKLPSQHFQQGSSLMQVSSWLNKSYLIILYETEHQKISTFSLQSNDGITIVEKLYNFEFFQSNLNFISILHTDKQQEIFYALTHAHERIDGELYQNGLIIGNMKNGTIIQRNYLTSKNIDLSPNGRYILDVPAQYQSFGQIIFHLRLLFSKSTLYMYMIDNCFMSDFSTALKQSIVKLL